MICANEISIIYDGIRAPCARTRQRIVLSPLIYDLFSSYFILSLRVFSLSLSCSLFWEKWENSLRVWERELRIVNFTHKFFHFLVSHSSGGEWEAWLVWNNMDGYIAVYFYYERWQSSLFIEFFFTLFLVEFTYFLNFIFYFYCC